tara:strand:- start:402 stop:719 length:318 start_codon:yes stop_codon:yes gene_type:complete
MTLPDVLQFKGDLTAKSGVYVASEKMINTLATTTAFKLEVGLDVVRDANIFLGMSKDECTWIQLKAISIFDVFSDPFLSTLDRTANAALSFDDIAETNIDRCRLD